MRESECGPDLCSLSPPSTRLIALIPSRVGGLLTFYLVYFLLWGWEVIEYQHNVSFPFSAVMDVASFFYYYYYFFKMIRPHAHAVEILRGQHLMMNVYDFLSHKHMKQNVGFQVVFLCHLFHRLMQKKQKSPSWCVAHPSTTSPSSSSRSWSPLAMHYS